MYVCLSVPMVLSPLAVNSLLTSLPGRNEKRGGTADAVGLHDKCSMWPPVIYSVGRG